MMSGWWGLQQLPVQRMQDTRAHGVSNRRQSQTDYHTRPLPSSLAGWARTLSLSISPLPSLLPAPAALCVTADLRCLAVPATLETRFDQS